jgi:hypothetical protein
MGKLDNIRKLTPTTTLRRLFQVQSHRGRRPFNCKNQNNCQQKDKGWLKLNMKLMQELRGLVGVHQLLSKRELISNQLCSRAPRTASKDDWSKGALTTRSGRIQYVHTYKRMAPPLQLSQDTILSQWYGQMTCPQRLIWYIILHNIMGNARR